MISIRDTIGTLWYPCPSCKNLVQVKDWGLQTCKYKDCSHNFEVVYDFATAEMILEEIGKQNISHRLEKAIEIVVRPSVPKLQRTEIGWIMIPQPPTSDPKYWYFSDKLLFKPYIEEMRRNL